jgi:predicted aspartyl protease
VAVNQRLISSRFPYLPIVLHVRQQTIRFDALIDTGFEGFIIVPHDTLSGEPADAAIPHRLADGSSFLCDAYVGTVDLAALGQFPAVVMALGNEWLIGRHITDQLRLILDHGQQVIAEP